MAKKGQKFSKYTLEEKQKIIKIYNEEGISMSQLGKDYGIPRETIKNWILHPEKSLSYSKRGRPKLSGEIDYKQRYEILKKYQAFLKEQQEKK